MTGPVRYLVQFPLYFQPPCHATCLPASQPASPVHLQRSIQMRTRTPRSQEPTTKMLSKHALPFSLHPALAHVPHPCFPRYSSAPICPMCQPTNPPYPSLPPFDELCPGAALILLIDKTISDMNCEKQKMSFVITLCLLECKKLEVVARC